MRPDAKGFFSALEHDQGVFTTRKKQSGALKGGGYFAQDEDGFFFQRIQVGVAEGVDFVVVSGVHDSGFHVQTALFGMSHLPTTSDRRGSPRPS